jgi:hypothetical protein
MKRLLRFKTQGEAHACQEPPSSWTGTLPLIALSHQEQHDAIQTLRVEARPLVAGAHFFASVGSVGISRRKAATQRTQIRLIRTHAKKISSQFGFDCFDTRSLRFSPAVDVLTFFRLILVRPQASSLETSK